MTHSNKAKKTSNSNPENTTKKSTRRGRPSSYTLNVPVNRQTLSILQTCVTLGHATSPNVVAGKLLNRAAEELREVLSQQISNNLFNKQTEA